MPLIKDDEGNLKEITWADMTDMYMEYYFRLGLVWKMAKMLNLKLFENTKSQEEREGDANAGR